MHTWANQLAVLPLHSGEAPLLNQPIPGLIVGHLTNRDTRRRTGTTWRRSAADVLQVARRGPLREADLCVEFEGGRHHVLVADRRWIDAHRLEAGKQSLRSQVEQVYVLGTVWTEVSAAPRHAGDGCEREMEIETVSMRAMMRIRR